MARIPQRTVDIFTSPHQTNSSATYRNLYVLSSFLYITFQTHAGAAKAVTGRSDYSVGPTAATETFDPLEFLPGVFTHRPNRGECATRNHR